MIFDPEFNEHIGIDGNITLAAPPDVSVNIAPNIPVEVDGNVAARTQPDINGNVAQATQGTDVDGNRAE